jgi:hypothetical protein
MPRPRVLITLIQDVLTLAAPRGAESRSLLRPEVVLPGPNNRLTFDPALEGGKTDSMLQTLQTLRALQWPAYIEVTEANPKAIKEVLIPEIGLIRKEPITTSDGVIELELDSCNQIFRFNPSNDPSNPDFLFQSYKLNTAVAIAYRTCVVPDVQPLPQDVLKATPKSEPVPTTLGSIDWTTVLKKEAHVANLFNEVAAQSCPLPVPTSGCIPFLFPRDGCLARAHRMCELLASRKKPVKAAKIWSFGILEFQTSNDCACKVHWSSHVATIVRVSVNGTNPKVRVLDPSMFDKPVTVDRWLYAQLSTTGKTLMFSNANVYHLSHRGNGRPEVCRPPFECESKLELLRRAEQLRIIAGGHATPPPFPCP